MMGTSYRTAVLLAAADYLNELRRRGDLCSPLDCVYALNEVAEEPPCPACGGLRMRDAEACVICAGDRDVMPRGGVVLTTLPASLRPWLQHRAGCTWHDARDEEGRRNCDCGLLQMLGGAL